MATVVPDALSGALGLTSTTWKNRVREAAYTSPSGVRVRFTYEDVSREYDKRTALFEFPGVDGGYVQDNGHGPRRYPLRCIFWGNNHDRIATLFEEVLLDRGVGRLEHPLYGAIDVVPFGTITRRDDLRSAANQTIVEVTFMTTVGAVYPSGQGNPRSEIEAALDAFDLAASDQFATATNLTGAVGQANVKNTVRAFLRTTSAALQGVADATSEVRAEFADAQSAINFGLDVLIGQPLQLAQQVCNLVKAPGKALIGIASRLEAYNTLAQSILASAAASGTSLIPGIDGTQLQLATLRLRETNDFYTSDLFAMNAVSGAVLSALETDFTTRPAALQAASAVLDQLDSVNEWREERFAYLSQIDTGGAYQALQAACALVAGFLVEASFTLATERRIVVDRPRTIIDLAAEIYGSVDDRLDDLINNNELTGSDILELQRGRVILYYA